MQHIRADHVRPLKLGAGKIGASEEGTIHLDPAQIEPREIQPGQIGRCEIRAPALAPFGLQVQPGAASLCSTSPGESARMAGRAEKSTIPAKGDRGLSEFGIGRSYSEARSTYKPGTIAVDTRVG